MSEEKMVRTEAIDEIKKTISKIEIDIAAQMIVLKTICHGVKAQGIDIPTALQDAYDKFSSDQQLRLAEVHKRTLAISN